MGRVWSHPIACRARTDIRSRLPSSIPFVALTNFAALGMNGPRACKAFRRKAEGTTQITKLASRRQLSPSALMRTMGGIENPGRYRVFSRVVSIADAFSASWTHRLILSKRSESARDRAVPQLPPPRMQSFSGDACEPGSGKMSLCSLAALQGERVLFSFQKPFDVGAVAEDNQESRRSCSGQNRRRIPLQAPHDQGEHQRAQDGCERHISSQGESCEKGKGCDGQS